MDTLSPPPDPPLERAVPLPMRCSPTIAALTVALAKAQGQFPAIGKDKTARIATKTGAAYSYTYADLATILAAVRKPLADNALALLQPVHVNGRSVSVTTIVAHGSGQWVADELTMPIGDPSDARSVASAITYSRRYALLSLLALAPAEEDDDADAATTRPAPPPARPTRTPPPAGESVRAPAGVDSSVQEPLAPLSTWGVDSGVQEPLTPLPTAMISEAQRKRFFAIGKEHGWTPAALKVWLAGRAITSTNEIPRTRYDALIHELLAAEREPAGEAPDQDQPF
jgi:hypothetical protein